MRSQAAWFDHSFCLDANDRIGEQIWTPASGMRRWRSSESEPDWYWALSISDARILEKQILE